MRGARGRCKQLHYTTQAGYVLHVGQVESKGDLKVGDEVSVKVPWPSKHDSRTVCRYQSVGMCRLSRSAYTDICCFLDVAHSVCLEFSGTFCSVCLLFFTSACMLAGLIPWTSFTLGFVFVCCLVFACCLPGLV